MHIKKIVLHKFKRFFLSGVETFKYEPNNNLTIINWTNGMGKSSFLSQLNPLPADLKKDYREDGYKYIEFSFENSEYVLSSGYLSSGKHSFVKDGVELNPGGTSSVQRQLVQEHLKLTPQMNNILLGVENFTTMSPAVRKYWFTELSPIDYSYSISLFQNIKTKARDLLGNIKITQDDILKKSKNILNQEDYEKYKKDIEIFNKITEELSLGYNTMIFSEYEKEWTEDDIKSIVPKFIKLVEQDREFINCEFYNMNNDDINKYKGSIEQNIKINNQKVERLENVLKVIGKSDVSLELNNVNKEIDNINNVLNKIKAIDIDYSKINIIEQEIINSRHIITDILDILLDSEFRALKYDFKITDAMYEEIEKEKDILRKYKTDYEVNEANILNLNKAKENDNTKCPKCQHEWKQGFNQEDLNKALILKQELSKNILNLLNKLKEKETKYKLKIKKREKVNELINVLSNKYLEYWFKPILERIEDTLEFDFINNEISKVFIDIEKHKKISEYKIKLEQLNKKKNELNLVIEVKQKFNIESSEVIEKQINETIDLITEENKKIALLNKYLFNRRLIDNIKRDAKDILKYKRKMFKYNVSNKRNEIITSTISNIKLNLNELVKLVNENETNKGITKHLQTMIDVNKRSVECLQVLLKILSPESGLIAKSINSFLNVFIEEMNILINRVWSYSIEILPCEIEDKDLDYKFRVKVNHDEIIEDVSKLSSSMQDIVNLSFKVIFMKYMGLNSYPLILDEFGRTMDAEHRISAFDTIDKVLTNAFDQIYLVCHFESMYSRFVNAEFLELKESKH